MATAAGAWLDGAGAAGAAAAGSTGTVSRGGSFCGTSAGPVACTGKAGAAKSIRVERIMGGTRWSWSYGEGSDDAEDQNGQSQSNAS